ncbi:MAG: ABC transporter substrate-binding protein [Actinobacteria bacterium]|nr:ABC transporter substrate-binding protein [Actinomycetota bacterium]
MKRVLSIIGVLIMAFTIMSMATSCAKQSSTNESANEPATQKPAEKKELTKIVVAEPGRGESWLPVYLASTLGYYEDEGLDVSFSSFKGGPLVIASLLAGDTQFALTGYEQVMKTYEKGKSTKMLLATTAKHPWGFVTAPNIKSISELKGKTVAGGMPGSSPMAFARACVKLGGLDPDKDVSFVDVPKGSEVAAMEKGDIAGYGFAWGRVKIELLKRGGNLLIDCTDPEWHRKVLGSDEYPLYVIQVTDEFIEEKPEVVQGFVSAVVRAMIWQNNHSIGEIAEQGAPMFQLTDKEILPQVLEETMKTQSKDGYFTEAGHDAATRLSLDVGLITKPVDMEKVVDESFLNKAHDKYGK